jgi:hypothetical protein
MFSGKVTTASALLSLTLFHMEEEAVRQPLHPGIPQNH